jgi:hypothetical protein
MADGIMSPHVSAAPLQLGELTSAPEESTPEQAIRDSLKHAQVLVGTPPMAACCRDE